MNDFGMTLAWNAARVSLVMIPAAAIYMIASRRSPLSGAWGAAMGLTVAILITIWGLVPGQEIQFGSKFKRQEIHSSPQATGANSLIGSSSVIAESNAGLETSTTTGINLRRLKGFMLGLGRHSGISITRLRACGRWFALLSIIGAIVGLTRLVFGLWAVSQCRRRGRTVEDKDVTDLLASFRIALKIRSEVELREMDDLATPATAGWLWPFIMLPSEWRNWDADELRAVLAHELAHIQRGDYGLGLLARYAVILNYLHPGVRWLSGQLQLQQELAADAIAAGIAGGRGTYLRALSSLALRQQGRVFNGPSRAFLAAQGTLIRRIDMLRVHEGLTSQSLRIRDKLFATLLLLAFAGGIATLRSPVLADEPNSDKANIRNDETLKVDSRPEPFDLSYLTESAQGFAAIRPAALFRRPGMARFGALFNAESHKGLLPLAMQLGIKLAEAEKGPLRVEMIEQASCSIQVETMDVKEGPKHRIITHTLMARTIEPFDWLKLARDWKLELTEVAVGDRKYFKVEGKLASYLGRVDKFRARWVD